MIEFFIDSLTVEGQVPAQNKREKKSIILNHTHEGTRYRNEKARSALLN